MKLSVYEAFEGYDPVKCNNYEAYLDGVKLEGCVAADEENGIAIVWDMEVLKTGYPDSAFKTLTGKVELRRIDA